MTLFLKTIERRMKFPKISELLLFLLFSTFHHCPAEECDFDCMGMLEDSALTSLSMVIEDERPSPLTPTEGVKFFLYHRDIADTPEVASVSTQNGDRLFNTFSTNRTTKIIIHGWMAHVPSHITNVIKNAYLSVGDYNLVMVDWSACGSLELYPWAKSSIPMVATQVGAFIDQLYLRYQLKPEDLHLIGHSLGAHIAGITGRFISSGSIGRITGLDPAGPLFNFNRPGDRLSRHSALFVDVVHTCGMYLGTVHAIGHVDFYPNRGTPVQPGCGIDLLGRCSHRRAYGYFAESIKNPDGFLGVSCTNWSSYLKGQCSDGEMISMGEMVPTNARGMFYLSTNSRKPFGRVQKYG